MSKGDLRTAMPTVAAIVDDFRKTFGTAYVNSIIRAGMQGEPVFCASENGHTIGTPVPVGWRAAHDAVATEPSTETNRERHFREARERSLAQLRPEVQTSARDVTGGRLRRGAK